MSVRIQSPIFDVGQELHQFTAGGSTQTGAIASFVGIVRGTANGSLIAMEIEHYPAMAKRALYCIEQSAGQKWPLQGCLIIHRFGYLVLGEPIVLVATYSAHRKAALQAVDYIVDCLKSNVPFWKKEILQSGAHWVENTAQDK